MDGCLLLHTATMEYSVLLPLLDHQEGKQETQVRESGMFQNKGGQVDPLAGVIGD